ncbi:MAG: hypothetical protein H6Q22_1527, partial [Bacteroidetes bacterium]|nr:hypothetical protein [Bacteroidota bacterium]
MKKIIITVFAMFSFLTSYAQS